MHGVHQRMINQSRLRDKSKLIKENHRNRDKGFAVHLKETNLLMDRGADSHSRYTKKINFNYLNNSQFFAFKRLLK